MAHMADRHWVHMDLAARNVLLGPGLVCKVADFGLTRQVDLSSGQFVQTEKMKLPMKWMSPESMDRRLVTDRCTNAYQPNHWRRSVCMDPGWGALVVTFTLSPRMAI